MNTKWYSGTNTSSSAWLQVDLGAGNAQDHWIWPSLARHSVNVLALLPIVAKPTAQTEAPDNPGVAIPDLKTWQLWYAQIKAGNRTFRFEGDPTEYDLNGPVSKERLQRMERNRKRDVERLAGHRKSSAVADFVSQVTDFSKPTSLAGLAAVSAFCAAAICYFLKRRSGRASAR